MPTPFPPYDPNGLDDADYDEGRGPRLREIPFRMLIPNLITVLAICAGLTGIRLAFENRFEMAVAMVLIAVLRVRALPMLHAAGVAVLLLALTIGLLLAIRRLLRRLLGSGRQPRGRDVTP